jgi:predicted negative regulator of RcsB-dependent stress response
MNENNKPFLAFLILGVAFLILVGWQIIISVSAHSNLQTALKGRVDVVDKAQLAQKNLENFVVDLIKLSETNEGAKTIVDKYQIRKGANAPQTGGQ